MTLYQIVQSLKSIALTSPYIRSTGEGSIYDYINTNPHSKYGIFFISQTNHRQDEYFDYYGFNLFVVDRLQDDLESNRLQIQSTAKEVLANTILTFINKFYGITHNELTFHPFTERFVDLCAGQYVQVTFKIPKTLICPDEYAEEFIPYNLKTLTIEVTENGLYEYEPEDDYDGYDKVQLTVDVFKNSQDKEVSITENGSIEITYDSGYTGLNKVTINTDVSGYTQDDLDNAYDSGMTYQKSLLEDINISHNGEYENLNGYGKVKVNVPQTGESINNQSKTLEFSGNGSYEITYDDGYTGLENLNLTIDVSGYTQDDLDNAYDSGITYQKSLLTTTSVTENGVYTREDGYSSIEVDVDVDAYYNSGYTSGMTDGYDSGITYQKSLLSAITITHNGEFIREDGYSAITVNVPQTGSTINNQSKIISVSANGEYTVTYDSGFTGLEEVVFRVNVSGDTPTPTPSGYSTEYLTTQAFSDGVITLYVQNYNYNKPEYRINGGEWISTTSETTNISVNSGDRVQYRMKRNLGVIGVGIKFITDVTFNVYGNILSMEYKDDFIDKDSVNSTHRFEQMFQNCTGLTLAGNLILPIKVPPQHCYSSMFNGCTSLIQPPELTATLIDNGCYAQMFSGCISLTQAPSLKNFSIAQYALNAFGNMFTNCSSLKYIECLEPNPTGHPNQVFDNWVYGVSSTGTFVKKQGVNWPTGNSGIPTGWTVIEE